MKYKLPLVIIALGLAMALVISPSFLVASDHDDGETDTKSRNTNLTDLYAFRAIDHNPHGGDPEGDLVFIMNTNPRSVARQQYYFATKATYAFHVTRIGNNNDPATGRKDITIQFGFGAPRGNQQQVVMKVFKDGGVSVHRFTTGGAPIMTTSINGAPIVNLINVGGHVLKVFAGLREDPFFFDVEAFFRVRAMVLGIGPAAAFRNPGLDFASGYNVNSVIVQIPLALLQGKTSAKTFDVWETISVGRRQVERLAQPAINEGLIVTNDFLNALNMIGPDCEADALAGREPCASAAAPILAEALRTLRALGNSEAQALAIALAFLPDVMRIDSTQPSGYAADTNASDRPIRGRKIKDDVIDITLSVVGSHLPAEFQTDNTSYRGPNLDGRGHSSLLMGFPFLAPPH